MRTSVIYLLFIFFSLCIAQAQQQEDKFPQKKKTYKRIYWNGSFGINISSGYTNINISPKIGYRFTEQFSGGAGVIYQYVKMRNFNSKISNYGFSMFTRYEVNSQFYIYGEYERLSFQYLTNFFPESLNRRGNSSVLLGGGYVTSLLDNGSVSFMALYNVLYNENERPRPYNSPWILRVNFGIGM